MSKKLLNIFLLLATAVMYFMFISPLYKGTGGVFSLGEGIKTLSTTKAEYDVALAEADNIIEDARQKLEGYRKITEEEKRKMMIMVPQSVDTIRLLHELDRLSVTTGLAFDSLSVAELSKSSNGVGSIGVSINVKTTYSQFKRFTEVLERSMRLFSIKSVTFTAPETEGDLISFGVMLETYYLP